MIRPLQLLPLILFAIAVGATRQGKKRDYTVRVTDCFKKINGKWLITHTHVSVTVDMQTGKADMESKP